MDPVILDSNIFFSYANELERQHDNCLELFGKTFRRLTCKRVINEINKVLKRRDRLYKELARLIELGRDLRELFRGKDLHENDERNLIRIIEWLESVSGDKLYFFRRFNRSIKISIEDALNKVDSPLIDYSWDRMLFESVYFCITNPHDAWIVVDSFCWCEKHCSSILCSTDETDIIRNRVEIEQICLRCRPLLERFPLNIMRVPEVLAFASN